MNRFLLVAFALGATGCFIPSSEYADFPHGGGPGGSGGSGGSGGGTTEGCRGGMVQACILDSNGSAAVATNVTATVTITEKNVVPFSGACAEFNHCYSNPTNNPVKLKLDGPGGPWFAVLGLPGLGAGAFDAGQKLELRVEANKVGGQTNQAFSLGRSGGAFVAFAMRKAQGPLDHTDIAGTGVSVVDDGVAFTVSDAGTCADQIHRVGFTSAGGNSGPVPPGTSTPAGTWYVAAERAVTSDPDAGTCAQSAELYVGGSTQN